MLHRCRLFLRKSVADVGSSNTAVLSRAVTITLMTDISFKKVLFNEVNGLVRDASL